MKKYFYTFIFGGLLGVVGGFAVGIFVYPYLFLADVVATEKLDNADEKKVFASGSFIHANSSDPIHYGSGSVTVYDDSVFLGEDFEVGPGPKFHVYLAPNPNVTSSSDVADTMFIDLGRLRAFKGSQVYPIPGGVTLSDYGSVVIWCEQFGVLISPATLQFAPAANDGVKM
jgi:hypothetical protein